MAGNFTEAITVDGGKVQVSGDDEIVVTADSDTHLSEISGVGGDNVVIESTGGAPSIVTDANGTFQFGSAQSFAVNEEDESVTFTAASNGSVTGISNVEKGTVAFYQDGSIEVNGTDITLSGGVSADSSVTLTTANSVITSVEGLFGLVNGLTGNATVSAIDSDVTVNSATIQINEGTTTDFEVQVESGTVKAITGINPDAVVTTAENVSVVTSDQGTFTFPSGIYNLSGSDSVSFVTDGNSKVVDIQGFRGTLTSNQNDVTVNGAAIYTSNTDASIISSGAGVGTVTGLQDGDEVIAPDTTKVVMIDESSLTVNNRKYELNGDANGVSISGSSNPVVSGLDPDANLVVANGGTYIVNNSTLKAINGDIIIGDPEGTAHIYEDSDIYFESNTEVENVVKGITGIASDTNKQTAVSSDSSMGSAINEGDTSGADGNLKVTLTNPDTDTETAQSVDFSSNTGVKQATLESGNQNLTFNNEGKNIAVVSSDSDGVKNITLGNGGDLVIVEGETKADVNVTAGTGKDTIVSAGNTLTADLSAGGATRVMATAGNVTLNNYNAETGAGIQVTNSDIYQSIKSNIINLGDNAITVKSANIAINPNSNSNNNSNVINFFDLKGEKYKVAYTHADGGTIDLSAAVENVILKGNYTGGTSDNILRSGNGDDSILAGANDIVDAGAGINKVELNTSGSTTIRQTAETGHTTVNGFDFGFGDNSDKVSIADFSKASVDYESSSDKLTFTYGEASLVLNGSSSLASSGDSSDDGASKQILIGEGDNAYKLQVAEKNSTIGVSENEDNRATFYRGNNSALDFSNVNENVNVVLSSYAQSLLGSITDNIRIGSESVDIEGFNKIKGGANNSLLTGKDDVNNTIVAGSGSTTIYGGKGFGIDSLVGSNSNTTTKNGSTTFVFLENSNKDIISGFEFIASDKGNENFADKIDFLNSSLVNAQVSGNDAVIELQNAEDRLIIQDGRGQNIQITTHDNNYTAKIDNDSLIYDGTANLFWATGKNAVVSVSSDITIGRANIILGNEVLTGRVFSTPFDDDTDTEFVDESADTADNSTEVPMSADSTISSDAIFYGHIKELDASGMDGTALLVGNDNDNVIRASKGASTLWGGSGSESNDMLIGNSGQDVFWYGIGQGKDHVAGADGNDIVYLYDFTIDDIANLNTNSSSFIITDKKGGSLTIDNAGTSGVNFRLADGSTFAYDSSENQWESK